MFESLSERLQGIFKSLRGHGVLTEAQVDAALREVRLALLEADVHFKVAKQLLERVRARALGQDVLKSLTPDQAVLRVVRDEMIEVLGGAGVRPLATASTPPTVILMAGLQGSGKTTSSAKLGRWLAGRERHPLLVSTDVQRPAAREQLRSVSQQAGLKVHHPPLADPREILRSALAEARALGHDTVIVDTAGRLHVDDALMAELAELRAIARPSEVLYVADALTGQDAVRSADEFHKRVGITGIVLTKLDGDSRGGAALSAAAVTGQPVKFAGTGEKVDALEPFDPERMVGRILGLGDVLGLIALAEQNVEREQAEDLVRRLRRQEFTLEDFREQLKQVRKMGPLEQVVSMLPGMGGALKGVDVDRGEREMRRSIAIVDSMTPQERRDPSLINGSRRKRIARGSGSSVEDVNRLLKQFVQTRRLVKELGSGGRAMKRLAARMPHLR
ncbi:MAG: signal recognition particle protein [Betaproteobacteria bacterium]